MKLKLTIRIWILVLVILILSIITFLLFNPIIIDKHNESVATSKFNKSYSAGDTIKIFEQFNFDSGNVKAILIINENKELSSEVPIGKVLKTENIELLKRMQKNFIFLYTAGDIATVENELLIYQNGKLIFRCGIVLDKDVQGLQDSRLGWITPLNKNVVLNFVRELKRSYVPIIFL